MKFIDVRLMFGLGRIDNSIFSLIICLPICADTACKKQTEQFISEFLLKHSHYYRGHQKYLCGIHRGGFRGFARIRSWNILTFRELVLVY